MKTMNILLAIVIALVAAAPALAAKPKVVILATGGTIAGAQAQNIPSDQRAVRLSWGCVGR